MADETHERATGHPAPTEPGPGETSEQTSARALASGLATLQRVLEQYIAVQQQLVHYSGECGYLRGYLHAHRTRGPLRRLWDWLWEPDLPSGPPIEEQVYGPEPAPRPH